MCSVDQVKPENQNEALLTLDTFMNTNEAGDFTSDEEIKTGYQLFYANVFKGEEAKRVEIAAQCQLRLRQQDRRHRLHIQSRQPGQRMRLRRSVVGAANLP